MAACKIIDVYSIIIMRRDSSLNYLPSVVFANGAESAHCPASHTSLNPKSSSATNHTTNHSISTSKMTWRRHLVTRSGTPPIDSHLSQYSPSILAMASMAVAIDGLSTDGRTCARLNDILVQVHEATHKVNDVSFSLFYLTCKMRVSSHNSKN